MIHAAGLHCTPAALLPHSTRGRGNKNMAVGNIAVVLHAHLPFVRHPEHETFLEELWFFEAMAETYIPLLQRLSRLEDDGVEYRLLLSLSPTLVSMMEDALLQTRFAGHLAKVIRLAEAETQRSANERDRRDLARFYLDYYRDILFWFEEKCNRRVASGFAALARMGNLQLMTCGATHGFFPILQPNSGAVRAQLFAARGYHTRIFGQKPDGIWIPECAYYPGVEKQLADAEFRYTFVDTHAFERASSQPLRGVYAPIMSEDGVAFFGRDRATSSQVWSADEGYPGHPDYREFYRDLGHELSEKELSEFIIDGHIRINTGLKFHRITSRGSEEKALYNPDAARERAARHAEHFLRNRIGQVERLAGQYPGRPPLIVAPYDAELFGHWWFEGPQFLEYVFRKMHHDQDAVKCMTPAEYLEKFPENQQALPAGSSWGGDGTYEFWVNDANQDIIPPLHQAADRMSEIAQEKRTLDKYGTAPENETTKQMMRELMLAEASDWSFIMRTGTSPEYAKKRIRDHLNRFWALDRMLVDGCVDEAVLSVIQQADNIFPDCLPDVTLWW
jgi:Uncharacterized conserved protein